MANSMMMVDYTMRKYGRSMAMLLQQQQNDIPQQRPNSFTRLPALHPGDRPDWAMGLCSVYLDELIVPLPRILPVPVEYAIHGSVGNNYHQAAYPHLWGPLAEVESLPHHRKGENESNELFEYRRFWRNFHPVPYYIPMGQDYMECQPPSSFPRMIEPDRLHQYLALRKAQDRDPYDPNDDDDCEGHRATQWVRNKLYETGVGNQHFPMDLCLHKDELAPQHAFLRGVDYMERLYVNLHQCNVISQVYDHRGVVYTHGIRYNNESGDFVPWALHTIALLHSTYLRLWMETVYRYVGQLFNFAIGVARDVQEMVPAHRMLAKFRDLDYVVVDGPVLADDWLENLTDIHRKMFLQQARHQTMLQVIRRKLELSVMITDSYTENNTYLSQLIPDIPITDGFLATSVTRTCPQLVINIYRLMDVTAFLVDFAQLFGPREHPTTVGYRRTTMRTYLRWGMSLLLFNPLWKLDYDVNPSKANELAPIRVPRVDITHNHRFQEYMDFLNRRILYYKPDWTAGYLPQHGKADLNHLCTGPL